MAFCEICRKELGYSQINDILVGQQRITACSECKRIIDLAATNDSVAIGHLTDLIFQDLPMVRIRPALQKLIDHSSDSSYENIRSIIFQSFSLRIATTKDEQLLIQLLSSTGKYDNTIISFNDLLDCEIQEDGITTQRSGMAGAIVGALLADTVGAVVGATTRKSTDWVAALNVCIFASSVPNGHLIITLGQNIKRNSGDYLTAKHNAQRVYNAVTAIIAEKERERKAPTIQPLQQDAASRLRDLKQLFDDGLITEDEFNKMRQKVLNSF